MIIFIFWGEDNSGQTVFLIAARTASRTYSGCQRLISQQTWVADNEWYPRQFRLERAP